MSEFDWIANHFRPLTHGQAGTFALANDAATLRIPLGKQLVITTDTLCEGIHFLSGTPANLIAQKALRVNLSDLAAMGAAPFAYNLALSLPLETNEQWIASFCEGLASDQHTFGLYLLGGDTARSPSGLIITITAFGLVEEGRALTRGGAQVGDILYVSGTIGDAGIGLSMLQEKLSPDEACIKAHQVPTPRFDVTALIATHATSCLDISDGLLQDANHIAAQSGIGLSLYASHIPLSSSAKTLLSKQQIDLPFLLTCGDDYQLLFTLPPNAACPDFCTAIGEVTEGSGILLLDEHSQAIKLPEQLGFQHF